MTLPALLGPLLDPTAGAIVLGGTVAATLLRNRLADIGRALVALRSLAAAPFTADPLIEQIAAFARIARRHGVVALDRNVIADPDLAAAIAAIVDGNGPDEVAALLSHARDARAERQLAAVEVWSGAAEAAPAMGMIGTLVGLVAMFTAMTDPAAIGGAMAVALLATLYGAVLANLLFAPLAARLRRRARVEAFERGRIESPLLSLAARERPRARPELAA
ncbi:motility protein A [Sphingomonas aracearum]|uniref:Biopolymer transporter ExbB n=1 Tax=Sphingomonas aracearum TaxID=2283317 RepID=A0A369VUW9_9SPHN|nr:MotA/TolQ/ExbB proton channel family protein [Sphingomonas aracearum]RDE05883.1 biopolymer transporter ExbB [Sphingomonas aracearum]